MFHHRKSAFARNISDLEGRLHALENELERTGRTAGRRASAGISAAGDQIVDAVASKVKGPRCDIRKRAVLVRMEKEIQS